MDKIMENLQIDEDELKILLQMIGKLNLKPIYRKILRHCG